MRIVPVKCRAIGRGARGEGSGEGMARGRTRRAVETLGGPAGRVGRGMGDDGVGFAVVGEGGA